MTVITKKTGKGNIHIRKGDITEMRVDAIVNAANAQLVLGGGVAGAIRRKGGPSIQEECNKIGGTLVGGAVITNGGNLPAAKVIHAVGPVMGEGDEDEKLRNATRNSLRLAVENDLKNIAFPAISTGIFGYPVDRCAKIMIDEVSRHLQMEGNVADIYFVLFDEETFAEFEKALQEIT